MGLVTTGKWHLTKGYLVKWIITFMNFYSGKLNDGIPINQSNGGSKNILKLIYTQYTMINGFLQTQSQIAKWKKCIGQE